MAYERPGGRLGFSFTQILFKTKGAGDGFRRFPARTPPAVPSSASGPVERAATVRRCQQTYRHRHVFKGRPTAYPVPWYDWRRKGRERHALADQLARSSSSARNPRQPTPEDTARLRQELQQVEAEIDTLAAALWGISATELQAIQASLSDLR